MKQRNHALYEDILPENYENSFANPAYAVKMLGEEFGVLAPFLYTEMRSLIGFTYEGRLDELVIRMELFSEVYAAFVYEQQENHKLRLMRLFVRSSTGSSVIMRMWRQKSGYVKWYVRRIILQSNNFAEFSAGRDYKYRLIEGYRIGSRKKATDRSVISRAENEN